MIKSKWIRRALLGGVAMTVMAAGAQADDLSALKAQIEQLQARINKIEARGAALPEGVSLITFQRGHQKIKMVNESEKAIDQVSDSRGLTIAITPTADLPAPATEITISGYVRNLVGYSRTNKAGPGGIDSDFWDKARGQIDIRSRTDTAVGQVRTHIQIRGDFAATDDHDHDAGATGSLSKKNTAKEELTVNDGFVMRIAVGEWDFMPGWTIRAGHAGQIYALTNVSFAGVNTPYGIDSSRHSQLGIHYSGGPIAFGFGIEDPSYAAGGTTSAPDFGAYMAYSADNIGLRVTGALGAVEEGSATDGNDMGWLVGVGANFSAGIFGFNAGFAYAKGMIGDVVSVKKAYLNNGAGKLHKAYGVQGNMTLAMTESTTFYVGAGYYNYTTTLKNGEFDHGFRVTGGLAWRPVDALQVAVEGTYASDKAKGGGKEKSMAGALGFWFFF